MTGKRDFLPFFRLLSKALGSFLVGCVLIQTLSWAAVTEASLRGFADLYPQLFQSPDSPVSYNRPIPIPNVTGTSGNTGGENKELVSLLMKSYHDQTDYETLSVHLKTGINSAMKPSSRIEQILASHQFSHAAYEEHLYLLANNAVYLKKFALMIKNTPSQEKLLSLSRNVPNFVALLPNENHRKVFQALISELKSPQHQVAPATPINGLLPPVPQMSQQNWRPAPLVPLSSKGAPQSRLSISWIVRSPAR